MKAPPFKLASFLLSALIVGLAWIALARTGGEPQFQGRGLSYWLGRYHRPPVPLSDGSLLDFSQKSDEALRQAGTNAVPTLLRMLRARDPWWTRGLLGSSGVQWCVGLHPVPASDLRLGAVFGFEKLGGSAKTAVPELLRTYDEALKQYLQTGSTDSTLEGCISAESFAVQCLSSIGPEARDAVPSLLRGLGITNHNATATALRREACWALGKIHSEPGAVVPALIGLLRDASGDPWIQVHASEALSSFGPDALPAGPALREAFDAEGDWEFRCRLATNIARIDHDQTQSLLPTLKPAFETETDSYTQCCLAQAIVSLDPQQSRFVLARLNEAWTTEAEVGRRLALHQTLRQVLGTNAPAFTPMPTQNPRGAPALAEPMGT